MNTSLRTRCWSAIALCLLTGVAAAQQKIERIVLPTSGLSEPIRDAFEDKGYLVTLDKGWTADFWFPKELNLPQQDRANPDALYPKLPASAFMGIMKLHQDAADYRGQTIRAGTYTLRYELLPQDGNHLGVSPNPDFLLVIPLADDVNPIQPLIFKKVVEMSSKTTGSHPAVIALDNAGEPGTVTKTDNGIVFSVAIPTALGAQKIGICLNCSASQ
jgi:hypothetical protein